MARFIINEPLSLINELQLVHNCEPVWHRRGGMLFGFKSFTACCDHCVQVVLRVIMRGSRCLTEISLKLESIATLGWH